MFLSYELIVVNDFYLISDIKISFSTQKKKTININECIYLRLKKHKLNLFLFLFRIMAAREEGSAGMVND